MLHEIVDRTFRCVYRATVVARFRLRATLGQPLRIGYAPHRRTRERRTIVAADCKRRLVRQPHERF